MQTQLEACPVCGKNSSVRPKLLLISEAWIPGPGKDARVEYLKGLRADDVLPENLREQPLEQFIDGLYCDRCRKGFVPEESLKKTHRRYN